MINYFETGQEFEIDLGNNLIFTSSTIDQPGTTDDKIGRTIKISNSATEKVFMKKSATEGMIESHAREFFHIISN